MPDLVFMDIHLSDGESFKIFDRVNITCPVIFTTAYDQYALKAFEVNSIDYLLKPINEQAVRRAVDKWRNLTGAAKSEYSSRVDTMVRQHASYRNSFLVRAIENGVVGSCIFYGPPGCGKTTILIAHRISTVQNMDKILFVDDGKILGFDTHENLYSSLEEYKNMVDLQRLEEEKGGNE